MKDLILGLAVAGILAFGYYLVDRFDRYMEKNRKGFSRGRSTGTKSSISFSAETSAEEIAEEVMRLRDASDPESVVVCIADDAEIPTPPVYTERNGHSKTVGTERFL